MPVVSGLFLRYFKLLSVITVKLMLIKTFVNAVGKRYRANIHQLSHLLLTEAKDVANQISLSCSR